MSYLERWKVADLVVKDVVDAVEQSERIFHVVDFDEDEAVCKHATWQRATEYLLKSALHLWHSHHTKLAAPRIWYEPDGSIDLHWRVQHRELLINIPEEEAMPASFYGDNKAGQIVKGRLDLSNNNQWLLMWLMQ